MAATMLLKHVRFFRRIYPNFCSISRAYASETSTPQPTASTEIDSSPDSKDQEITDTKPTENIFADNENTFYSLLRRSKWMQLGDPMGKEVVGTIKQIQGNDIYIDIGHKFYCICEKPRIEGSYWHYRIGSKVRVRLEDLELAAKFKMGYKSVTALEASGVLMGPLGGKDIEDQLANPLGTLDPDILQGLDLFEVSEESEDVDQEMVDQALEDWGRSDRDKDDSVKIDLDESDLDEDDLDKDGWDKNDLDSDEWDKGLDKVDLDIDGWDSDEWDKGLDKDDSVDVGSDGEPDAPKS
ncbi:28S ribosomal protein S28, mitochondrial-like [Lingula anatina]|uniref:28S ribosomal protein S28, mitochondrial-like n=1 Tax=Lingula anatina TaxID=7574 RepID=A0A1S3JWG6_LINAN|nr:28S ribosomal protein S28, mitochondrial-like [Lingula anatina]|eukprot:XP_013414713.1 28S ribosomal protein S28, mitochondrial-like [Lingula anatina]